MSDDTPTERFTPPAPSMKPSATHVPSSKPPRSKALIIALAVLGALLLIAVVVLLTLLFARGTDNSTPRPSNSTSPTPEMTASETPSASPSETPSAEPSTPPSPTTPPATTGPVFNSFSPSNNSSAGCTTESGGALVTFTWTSTCATEAAIGVGTLDAFAGFYEAGLPASGSYSLNYQCNLPSQIYTVSIKGVSGQTNKTVTLKR